jgi:hypothetical protein
MWDYEDMTCLEYWAKSLEDDNTLKLIKPLRLREKGDLLLLRYGDFFPSLVEVNGKMVDFWEAYDGFYSECRSLVIDKEKSCLVLTPFRKFRNLNECEKNSETNIRKMLSNAKNAEISVKLDGSMQSARWYGNKLVMSGSQALDRRLSKRLDNGYVYIENHENYLCLLKDHSDYTAIFENINENDPHIVQYSKGQQGLYLIGLRNSLTGEELPYSQVTRIAHAYNVKSTRVVQETFSQVIASLDSKKANEAEGYVLDIDGYKVKIKYNDYVRLHRSLQKLTSDSTVIRAVSDGTWDDLYSKLPNAYKKTTREKAEKIKSYVNLKTNEAKHWYHLLKQENFESKKENMTWVNDNVPQESKALVRELYYGNEISVLKSKSGSYVKMTVIESYLEKLAKTQKQSHF